MDGAGYDAETVCPKSWKDQVTTNLNSASCIALFDSCVQDHTSQGVNKGECLYCNKKNSEKN